MSEMSSHDIFCRKRQANKEIYWVFLTKLQRNPTLPKLEFLK